MAKLMQNRYGKARVRVMKVVRHDTHHAMKEWSVRVLLHGDFETSFTAADNSKVLATDTMKNTVYWLARRSHATTIEEFGEELATYLIANNPQVSRVEVELEEQPWGQLLVDGIPHPTTYTLTGAHHLTATINAARGETIQIQSGFTDFVLLKTTHSEFTGFIRDKLTTLPETRDRIFATKAAITWRWRECPLDFEAARTAIRSTLLSVFAHHHSLSVQQTLYDMGKSMLEAHSEVGEITLTMPNLHCLLVDLSRFGEDNPNQIYVPTEEPHGYIEATITR